MPFVLPSDPSPGNVAPASWGDAVRDGLNYLANPPACRVYHSATQSLPDAVDTVLAFNSERFDTDSMHSTSSNTNRITFNTDGLYVVCASAAIATGGDYVQTYGYFRTSTGAIIGTLAVTQGSVIAGPFFSGSTIWKFSVGQYVEVLLRQDNTANAARNVLASASYQAEFAALWVGLG